ncbi:UDP-N-acetylenolpyruvoylglucosamine reductase [Spirochaetia bacterium]|nr:UDP-N-acetylenolpyruvoylglucosamine reductase [Spirochaetia bacterium]
MIMKNMAALRSIIDKLSSEPGFSGDIRFDEPMSLHTTFKVGGLADVWVRPDSACFPEYAAMLLRAARSAGVPVFVLGGGANLVVADRGIRGIVLDTGGWTGWDFAAGDVPNGNTAENGARHLFTVAVRSGTAVDTLVDAAAECSRGGLEFLAGMPGTVGGAVWMNARCMEKSVSDVLGEVEILDEDFNRMIVPYNPADFAYKKSPFQGRDVLILSARFRISKRAGEESRREADTLRRDREAKGHFRAPSAGSAFKNNRAFGKPTGKIIDDLRLRGFSVGGAAVAPWHGNFIINTGNARAADIRALADTVTCQVREKVGVTLEPEILFVGDWDTPVKPRNAANT